MAALLVVMLLIGLGLGFLYRQWLDYKKIQRQLPAVVADQADIVATLRQQKMELGHIAELRTRLDAYLETADQLPGLYQRLSFWEFVAKGWESRRKNLEARERIVSADYVQKMIAIYRRQL